LIVAVGPRGYLETAANPAEALFGVGGHLAFAHNALGGDEFVVFGDSDSRELGFFYQSASLVQRGAHDEAGVQRRLAARAALVRDHAVAALRGSYVAFDCVGADGAVNKA
jgi:hypothetical protein